MESCNQSANPHIPHSRLTAEFKSSLLSICVICAICGSSCRLPFPLGVAQFQKLRLGVRGAVAAVAQLGRLLDRQPHGERAALARTGARGRDLATVAADDPMADR